MKIKNYLLGYKNMYIYQDTESFNFSLDSVLLPNFVTLNKNINKIIDIGCGNAPISLILSTKTDALITGVEIQKEIATLAQESVLINQLNDQIQIINQDIKLLYKNIESDSYDVVVCNPPFFKINENSKLNKNDTKTIARHELMLNLDDLFKISKKILKNNGIVALVHRPERLVDILCKMREYNIEPKKIRFVYPKVGKNANMVLVEGRKNGNPGLKILENLIVHDEHGNYTQEVLKYFER